MSKWRLKLAYSIAGKELQAERSRRNRIFKKMLVAYIINSVVEILDDKDVWKSKKQRTTTVEIIESFVNEVILGENK